MYEGVVTQRDYFSLYDLSTWNDVELTNTTECSHTWIAVDYDYEGDRM